MPHLVPFICKGTKNEVLLNHATNKTVDYMVLV